MSTTEEDEAEEEEIVINQLIYLERRAKIARRASESKTKKKI